MNFALKKIIENRTSSKVKFGEKYSLIDLAIIIERRGRCRRYHGGKDG
jgi:hypothetical protein